MLLFSVKSSDLEDDRFSLVEDDSMALHLRRNVDRSVILIAHRRELGQESVEAGHGRRRTDGAAADWRQRGGGRVREEDAGNGVEVAEGVSQEDDRGGIFGNL